ncbi:MAG TPA: hypothetical protein EYP32_00850 [Aquificaceae bacterium]|nr:hypothetical protein [Aquificaceae bacterium]HIQ48752.1 hypothetical protein [Aquifex aeolicus]
MKNKELIRINLNKRAGFLQKLRGLDTQAITIFITTNILSISFFIGLIFLALAGIYYYTLSRNVEELKVKLEEERNRREKILAEIKRLEKLKKSLKTKSLVYELMDEYNRAFFKAFSEGYKNFEGTLIQNISICAFRERNCDLSKRIKKGSILIKAPIVQIDFILLGDNYDFFGIGEIKRQTFITIAEYPYKRLCLEIKKEKEMVKN